jgi:hypothetical protein
MIKPLLIVAALFGVLGFIGGEVCANWTPVHVAYFRVNREKKSWDILCEPADYPQPPGYTKMCGK